MPGQYDDNDVNVLAFPSMNPGINESSSDSDSPPMSLPSEDYIPDSDDSARARKKLNGTHDSPNPRKISIKRKKNVPN